MLSEVAGNKMISFVTSFTGGATPALSETSSSNRHMEASSVPINKSVSRSDKCSDMPPPRNPMDSTVATPNPTHPAAKLKVQELNEFFLCFLCAGYKVEATTINECMHSFCRSCIVKHLEVKHYCPECFHKKFVVNSNGNGNMLRIGIANGAQPNTVQTPRIITSQNLYLDHALSALIYKTVPGLYQKEISSVQRFYSKKSEDLKPINVEPHQCSSFERILFQDQEKASLDADEQPVYVSADEPISLSLEYHPQELQGLSQISPENMPKVQYLQCPAGVRIRHLEKFLCSKFSISPTVHSVELIYEDSIVHKDFNLMDVVYCFNWKRDGPMRFFYRIFMHGQVEPPSMRMKMVVKDNDDKKKLELLPPITKTVELPSNGVVAQNEKRQENKIKLSHIIGSSSSEAGDTDQSSPRDGGAIANRQQISTAPGLSSTDKSSGSRSGEKRKLKDDYEFVDEVTISKMPKGAKSPSSSAMRSPQRQQHSPKSVTFNDTVQATRIPLITYVNPVTSPSASPPNDFKRLRSNDIGSSSSSPPKVTTTSSSTTASVKNTSSAATNDSSRITSGTVPDNNSKQFPSNKQQPQPTSTQLHASASSSSSSSSAQQISSKQTKGNTQQLHSTNNKSEKFPKTSSSLSAKDETAIGNNNRHPSSGSGSSANQKKKHGDPKNDFNGNLRHEKNQNVARSSSDAAVENRIEADKYEYAKNIGLKPIHEVVRRVVDDKNKDVDARRKAVAGPTVEDPASMLYHKKKKKSKHSKDFPFADVKKKKVDYDLAISSSNVPKTISSAKDSNGSRSGSSEAHHHHPDSLKMKFVKVTTSDKNNAKVMVVPKSSSDREQAPTNGRSPQSTASTQKSPSPPKAIAPLPTLSVAPPAVQSSGSKSPKGGHSPKVPKLSNFVIKDSSMEIHQISKSARSSPQQQPKKSPSPPSLTITSTGGHRTPTQHMQKPQHNSAQAPKRTQSLTKSGGGPPAKKPHIPLQNQRSMDHSANNNKDMGSASPFLQRSYSYDPSVVMGSNYNLPLTPFQFQLATQMMLQKQLQQEWAQAAAAKQAASANAIPPPAPMLPFFNAPMPQSRSPPVNNSGSSSKKPVPPLVPPSSLGKYNPVPNLVASSASKQPQNNNQHRLQEKPPMVEIARLPPGLDKVEIPHIPVKVPPKANRPPPPTIPLVKIRRASANSTSSTESGDGHTSSRATRDVPAVLDLSGKPASFGDGKVSGGSSQKPLPQLNEISKISRGGSGSSSSNALIHRQQSASVRSVPNPSALALRNQLPSQSSAAGKGPVTSSATSSPSMSPSARMSPPAMASFTSKSSNLEKLASKIKEGVSTITSQVYNSLASK